MSKSIVRRNYSIIGEERIRAQEKGLLEAEWYASPIPKQKMKEFMKRKDGPAIRDTLIWFVLLFAAGYLAYLSWGTWWAIPAFTLYGILYYTPAQSRWHECSHGTAFKTAWMNEALYQISSFMALMPATVWKWSHHRHHTDTIIVGSDPEIYQPRPPFWRIVILEIFHIVGSYTIFTQIVKRSIGVLSKEEQSFMPTTIYRKVVWESRIYVLIYLFILGLCVYTQSLLPAMFIGLPVIYGSFYLIFLAISQHVGLYEDVLDHRLNCRSYHTNIINRFLYWNMNYHLEHHMFPMVPYHALPALHKEMKQDCPPACPSAWSAFKEAMVALWIQRKEPGYTSPRVLPITARPFKYL